MPASERDAQSSPHGLSARPKQPSPVSGCSMSDLLASCAAASAVSTPPVAPSRPTPAHTEEQRRDAA